MVGESMKDAGSLGDEVEFLKWNGKKIDSCFIDFWPFFIYFFIIQHSTALFEYSLFIGNNFELNSTTKKQFLIIFFL